MKRTALVAAAVTILLIAAPALAARASAASTDTALDTLSGIVLETVRESPGDPHADEDDERHLVLATDTSIVPLSEGGPQLTRTPPEPSWRSRAVRRPPSRSRRRTRPPRSPSPARARCGATAP